MNMLNSILEIIQGKVKPNILLIYGEENFLIEEALAQLLNHLFIDRSNSFDLEIIDNDNSDISYIALSCASYPFVSPKRVVVVRNIESYFPARVSKKVSENSLFSQYLQDPIDSTLLIMTSNYSNLNGIKKNLSNPRNRAKGEKQIASLKFPYDIVIQKHHCIEFAKVEDSKLTDWIIDRFKMHGKKVEPEAAQFIYTSIVPDLFSYSNEIEKLLIHIQNRDKITLSDVKEIVGTTRQYSVFDLQNSVGQRDLPKSLEILHRIMKTEDQSVLIITILTRYFVSLWKLLELGVGGNKFQIAPQAGFSPYFFDEYAKALKNYKDEEIMSAFNHLADTDKKIKSTSTDSLYLVQQMIISIINRSNQ